jgi:tetratricopeptide (TPR) repeat protein
LKGVIHAVRMTKLDLDAAEDYFQSTLANDPEYAPAYVGLSKVWSLRQQMNIVPRKEAGPRLKAFAEKALELDPSLPEAHERVAIYQSGNWNWGAADIQYQQAIRLGPDLAEARAACSHFLYRMKRRAEARVQIQRALELDPLNEQVRAFYAVSLEFEHRYTDEEAELRSELKTNPNSPLAATRLAVALHLLERYEEAFAAERSRWRGDSEIDAALARGHAEGGYRGAMRRVADVWAGRARTTGGRSMTVAELYKRAGAADESLEWLNMAVDAQEPNVSFIGIAPLWDDLHGDARFRRLLRRMNLPM